MGRLKDLTEFLIKIPGRRKAMILVSEAIGFDATDFQDYNGTAMNPAAQAGPRGHDRCHAGKHRHLPDSPWRCVPGDGPVGTGHGNGDPESARGWSISNDGTAHDRRRHRRLRARELEQLRRLVYAPCPGAERLLHARLQLVAGQGRWAVRAGEADRQASRVEGACARGLHRAVQRARQRHLARANPRCRRSARQPDPRRRRDDSRLRRAVQGQGKDGRNRWSRWRWTRSRWDWRRKPTARCAD